MKIIRTLVTASVLSAFALFIPLASATEAPADKEKATATKKPGDTMKKVEDPACKDILANQPMHTKAEIEKCGPSE